MQLTRPVVTGLLLGSVTAFLAALLGSRDGTDSSTVNVARPESAALPLPPDEGGPEAAFEPASLASTDPSGSSRPERTAGTTQRAESRQR